MNALIVWVLMVPGPWGVSTPTLEFTSNTKCEAAANILTTAARNHTSMRPPFAMYCVQIEK
jgi:hypothetical protein